MSIPHPNPAIIKSKNPRRFQVPCEGSQLRRTPAAVTQTMAMTSLLPRFSLNNIAAMMAVATPSMFRRREAENPDIRVRPIIREMGARIPPDRTAPASQGQSLLFRALLDVTRGPCAIRRSTTYSPRPKKAPR